MQHHEESTANLMNVIGEGWVGDWSRGARPEGYLRTQERIEYLKNFGLDLKTAFDPVFQERYSSVLKTAKKGQLIGAELDTLLECNRQLSDYLDQFEASISEDDKNFYSEIQKAESIDDLWLKVSERGGIQGSRFHSLDELKRAVEDIKDAIALKRRIDPRVLPRAYGFRIKAGKLLGIYPGFEPIER